MERRFRLTSSIEIQRVRRSGKSFAHPLLVLILQAGNDPISRFAVTAGTSIGNAVQRNRAKRLLRAALREVIADFPPGYNGILIARKPLVDANFSQTSAALKSLLNQAGIASSNNNG
ncbi:MAG TPA: ribonuclease P protein component [Chloroflexi bacterium]|nr:MAG: ribonuclease P protein component [Chloroflexota bacterium]HDN04725.1 ribonuclease P protein component [Chloroflexota bacterium]